MSIAFGRPKVLFEGNYQILDLWPPTVMCHLAASAFFSSSLPNRRQLWGLTPS